MPITELLVAAFAEAKRRYPELGQSWVQLSHRVGGLIPNSLLAVSVQRDGDLDLLVRAMEDDFHKTQDSMFAAHYQKMFSEIWISSAYETLRLLAERKLAPETDQFRALAHDLRLLRIPLEKHEITSQGQLTSPIKMQRLPPNNDQTDIYVYDKADPRRSHIMPSGVSQRGSMMWQVLDIKANTERWIERRTLSDSFLSLWPRPSDVTALTTPNDDKSATKPASSP